VWLLARRLHRSARREASGRVLKRARRATALLALASTLGTLALLEGASRLYLRLRPEGPRAADWDTDALAPPPAPPGAFRIFLYGGSTVAGNPLVEYSFARQLEFWLHRLAPQRTFQIVNYGAPGKPTEFAKLELERTIGARPDLVIVHSLHNEFLGWRAPSASKRMRREIRRWLDATATARVMRSAFGEIAPARRRSDRGLLLPARIAAEDRGGAHFQARVAAFERAAREIAALARAGGVPLIFATDSGNLADWPPVWRFVRDERYERAVTDLRAQIARGDLATADSTLVALSADHPGDAMLAWLAGRLAMARRDWPRARAAFDAARDADPMPWRVLSRFNEHLRALALGGDALLADVDVAFRREAEHGLVGFALVADNCHPTPLGNALLARELLRAMAHAKLGIESLDGLPPLAEQAEIFVREARRERPDAELAYLLANAVYAMKGPFYNFEASADYLERAREIAPDDDRVWANLATVSVLSGRTSEGGAQMDRAAALRGAPFDPDDRRATPYLREALAILAGEVERFAPADALEPGAHRTRLP
jgi:tetratricopeptide (TPR) repeat protein